jgi:Ca-activated chloride channel family protein
MEITFLRPVYLTFLLSVPFFIIMHFLILRHIKRRALKFANFDVIEKATGGHILNKNITLLIVRLCAMILLIFSVAGTMLWYNTKSSDSDYVIAIDSSSSMLADDFTPSRFEAAKSSAINFVDKLPPMSLMGLVGFAGTSTIELPMAADKTTMKEKIKEMVVQNTGGTDISSAIVTASNLLISSEKAKTIVLITDGRSTSGEPIEYGIEYANKNRVTVFTIGMATVAGGKFAKIEAISTIDEEALNQIAKGTGGKYYPATSVEGLNQAYGDISVQSDKKVSLALQFPLMLAALFLLFLEWGLINTKYRTLP